MWRVPSFRALKALISDFSVVWNQERSSWRSYKLGAVGDLLTPVRVQTLLAAQSLLFYSFALDTFAAKLAGDSVR